MESVEQKLVRRRGPFGQACLYLFIVFNMVMAIVFLTVVASPPPVPRVANFGELLVVPIGVAIGRALMIGQIIVIWFGGTVVLGLLTLLTRGRKRLVTEAELEQEAATIREPEPQRVWHI